MQEPKSNYVKAKIKGMKFTAKNRKYVHILLDLERWALNGPSGWADAMRSHGVILEYEKDYLEILKELRPDKYKEYLKGKKELDEEDRKLDEWSKKEDMKELHSDKNLWKKFGGRS